MTDGRYLACSVCRLDVFACVCNPKFKPADLEWRTNVTKEDDEFEQQVRRMQAEGFNFPVRDSELVKAWRNTKPVGTSQTLSRAVAAMIQVKRAERVIDRMRGLFERAAATGVLGPMRDPEDADADDTPADLFYGELHNLEHEIKVYDIGLLT